MTYSATEQHNLELVMAMYEAVLKPMDASQVDRFIAPDYIQHSSLLAESGPAALKPFIDAINRQSPHASTDIKRIFADGDHVIVHTHVTRHAGDSGLAVVDIFRVRGDQLVEHWDVIQEIDPSMRSPESMF
jgi:predicted SnoaL-like aldol condensation-catalyzing enzyme